MENQYKNIFAVAAFISFAACFMTSCTPEDDLNEEQPAVVKSSCEVVHESVTVGRGALSRAAIDDNMDIIFQEGDRLFLEAVDADGKIVGFGSMEMTEESEPGTGSASFAGDLAFKTDAAIAHRTYFLIGKDDCQYEFKEIAELAAENDSPYAWVDNEDVKAWKQPCGYKDFAVVGTIADAIEKYSELTYEDDVNSRHISSIALSQQNVFLQCQLEFESETGICADMELNVGCEYDGGSSLVPATITTKEVGDAVVAEFVMPMNPTFTYPQFVVSRVGYAPFKVKFGKASNVLESGTIYDVKKTVDSSKKLMLTKDMPVGTIGVVDGREAIVVDLGESFGKVGIAIINEGATCIYRVDGEYVNLGTSYNFYDADELDKSNTLGEYWHVPTKEEFEALANLKDAEGNKIVKWNGDEVGLEWDFGTGKLFLQGYWYDECRYWSCTPETDTSDAYGYFLYSDCGKCEVGCSLSTYSYRLRLFCTLP